MAVSAVPVTEAERLETKRLNEEAELQQRAQAFGER